MRRLAACAVLLLPWAGSACRHAAPEPPPRYPYAGFGRVGCYAGPGLNRMYSGDAALPTTAMLAKGPWLILDSLRARDHGLAEQEARLGTLLERRDTLERTLGFWARVAPDSIVFTEGSAFPSVTWRFRQSAEELRGTGVLVHDM